MSYKLLCYLQVAQLTLRVAGVVVISQQNAVHSVRVPQARYVVAAGGGEGRGEGKKRQRRGNRRRERGRGKERRGGGRWRENERGKKWV